jgi:transposase
LDQIVKVLDSNLKCIDTKCYTNRKQYIFTVESTSSEVICPHCGKISTKVHSVYQREVQDLPIQNMNVILLINTRKMVSDP